MGRTTHLPPMKPKARIKLHQLVVVIIGTVAEIHVARVCLVTGRITQRILHDNLDASVMRRSRQGRTTRIRLTSSVTRAIVLVLVDGRHPL